MLGLQIFSEFQETSVIFENLLTNAFSRLSGSEQAIPAGILGFSAKGQRLPVLGARSIRFLLHKHTDKIFHPWSSK